MKILIVGQGKVGQSIAEALNKEHHEIVVIDHNPKVLSKKRDQLDVICVEGNGANAEILQEAKVSECNLCIAVTSSDEINLLSCLMAKKLGAKNTIARVRNPHYSRDIYLFMDELGLSMHINPEFESAREIARLLRFPTANKMESFCGGKVDIIEGTIEENSPLNGLALKDLFHKFKVKIIVCAVVRDNEVIIPDGNFTLRFKDKVNIVGALSDVEQFVRTIKKEKPAVQNAMIVGGGIISYYLARSLAKLRINTKIIEIDELRCNDLALRLPETTIIQGDGTDIDLLQEEGYEDMDAFIALTGIDEENMILALNALNVNVNKVIAKVDHLHNNAIVGNLGIDSIICPKDITANHIVSYVRAMQNSVGSNIAAMSKITGGKAEALEFVVKDSMKFIGIPLAQLKFKSDLLVATIVREGRLIYPNGSDVILANDHIVVVTTKHGLKDVHDIFV